MQDAVRFAYGFSHIIAVAAFILTGFWRRFPVCTLYLAVASVLAVSYNPESKLWISGPYMAIEPVSVALRFAAAAEAMWCLTEEIRDWLRLILGLTLIGVAAVAAIWSLEPAGTVYTFVQIRRFAQIGTAVFMLSGLVFLWSQRLWRWNTTGTHGFILITLLWKQAVYSIISLRIPWVTKQQWQSADWPGLVITSLCCLAWTILALKKTGIRVQSAVADH